MLCGKSARSIDFLSQLKLATSAAVSNLLMNSVRDSWTENWRAYPHVRQTKQFRGSPNRKFSLGLASLSRRNVTRLLSGISGHGPFHYHQSLIDPIVDPSCRFCDYGREYFLYLHTKWLCTCQCLFTWARPGTRAGWPTRCCCQCQFVLIVNGCQCQLCLLSRSIASLLACQCQRSYNIGVLSMSKSWCQGQ